MANSLKYPIAISRESNKLINAIDAINGKNCNCYCVFCNENMIAVNKVEKQRAHFRHDINSNCKLSNESYHHWLAKEVFKTIKKVTLPPIDLQLIRGGYSLDCFYAEFYKKYSLPEVWRDESESNQIFQPITTVEIESMSTEQVYKSEKGNVRIDIVLKVKDNDLFIEPFSSNEIDEDKLNKLSCINISTITIELRPFVMRNDFVFTIEEFKRFLSIDIESKRWEYIREEKKEALIKKKINELEKRIEPHIKSIREYNKIENQISEKTSQKFDLESKLREYEYQISKLKEVQSKIEFKLSK
jgi:hypothetical protein